MKKSELANLRPTKVRWINPPTHEQLVRFVRALAVVQAKIDHAQASRSKRAREDCARRNELPNDDLVWSRDDDVGFLPSSGRERISRQELINNLI